MSAFNVLTRLSAAYIDKDEKVWDLVCGVAVNQLAIQVSHVFFFSVRIRIEKKKKKKSTSKSIKLLGVLVLVFVWV